jgi:microcystin-dependent protein
MNAQASYPTPYLGEIRMAGFHSYNVPPGWELCEGQVLQIEDYPELFGVIGTTHGGNGTTNFQLPDFRGRVPVHRGQLTGGSNYALGQQGGSEGVVLTLSQMATHNHTPACSSQPGYLSSPSNAVWAVSAQPLYSGRSPNVNLLSTIVGFTGGGQPHNNVAPYLCVTFMIAVAGTVPAS